MWPPQPPRGPPRARSIVPARSPHRPSGLGFVLHGGCPEATRLPQEPSVGTGLPGAVGTTGGCGGVRLGRSKIRCWGRGLQTLPRDPHGLGLSWQPPPQPRYWGSVHWGEIPGAAGAGGGPARRRWFRCAPGLGGSLSPSSPARDAAAAAGAARSILITRCVQRLAADGETEARAGAWPPKPRRGWKAALGPPSSEEGSPGEGGLSGWCRGWGSGPGLPNLQCNEVGCDSRHPEGLEGGGPRGLGLAGTWVDHISPEESLTEAARSWLPAGQGRHRRHNGGAHRDLEKKPNETLLGRVWGGGRGVSW